MIEAIMFEVKENEEVYFNEIEENDIFLDENNELYRKIKRNELNFFHINTINAINMTNGGLSNFQTYEKVKRVSMKKLVGV